MAEKNVRGFDHYFLNDSTFPKVLVHFFDERELAGLEGGYLDFTLV